MLFMNRSSLTILALLIPFSLRADEKGIEHFEKKIRPVLVKECYRCHSPEKRVRGGLDLSTKAGMLKGGDTGPAMVPGKPEKSLLMKAVRWQGIEMPPKGKLTANEIAILEKWIEQGAAWPDAKAVVTDKPKSYDWKKLRADHWAFRPV